jgi:hypothetical protein
VPCRLLGAFEALPPDRRVPRPIRIDLKIGAPLWLTDLSDDHQGWQQAALTIQTAVSALIASNT